MKLTEIQLDYKPNPFADESKPQNPFTIAFCYPKDKDPFVIKGGWVDVEQYLKSTINDPILVHVTYWWKKAHRTAIHVYNLSEEVYFVEKGTRKKRWEIYTYKGKEKNVLANVRRIPRKWIKELNPYAPVKRGERKRLFRLERDEK
jgi:hypothetical protein